MSDAVETVPLDILTFNRMQVAWQMEPTTLPISNAWVTKACRSESSLIVTVGPLAAGKHDRVIILERHLSDALGALKLNSVFGDLLNPSDIKSPSE